MRNSVLDANRKRGNRENPNQHTGRKRCMVNDGLSNFIHGFPGISIPSKEVSLPAQELPITILGLRGIEWAIFDVEGLTNRHIT